jgi:hypothetical protein
MGIIINTSARMQAAYHHTRFPCHVIFAPFAGGGHLDIADQPKKVQTQELPHCEI